MQIKEISYRECCQEQDMKPLHDDKFYCIHCGALFEEEKYTDAAGDTDTRFVRRENARGMAKPTCEMFVAFIEWILQCKVPNKLVKEIEKEQQLYTGDGYAALQEFICKKIDSTKMPAFITGIGLIEAAEKIAICAGECSLDKDDFKNGIDFCRGVKGVFYG